VIDVQNDMVPVATATMNRCPFCAEDVRVEATVCPHCARPISAVLKNERKSHRRTGLYIAAYLAMATVVFLFMRSIVISAGQQPHSPEPAERIRQACEEQFSGISKDEVYNCEIRAGLRAMALDKARRQEKAEKAAGIE
jgi:hypothetical protein